MHMEVYSASLTDPHWEKIDVSDQAVGFKLYLYGHTWVDGVSIKRD